MSDTPAPLSPPAARGAEDEDDNLCMSSEPFSHERLAKIGHAAQRLYTMTDAELDRIAAHPEPTPAPDAALREAVLAFLAKHPAQIGSKSNREDYGSFVTTADLWALHTALRAALAQEEGR